jgi:DNA-binding transcriptional MerR regulator
MNKSADAFRTISEVAEELDLPQHVLRFWESRFPHIRPMKRGGGRRYYRPDDVELLRGVRHLLYAQGYTIRGVQRILREEGPRFVQTVWQEGAPQPERQPEVEAAEREDTETEELLMRSRSAPGGGGQVEHRAAPAPQPPDPERTEDSEAADSGDAAAAAPPTEAEPSVPPEPLAAEPERARKLSDAERERLQSALEMLAACKRLLDDGFAELEQNP